jgi:hypothetical protein
MKLQFANILRYEMIVSNMYDVERAGPHFTYSTCKQVFLLLLVIIGSDIISHRHTERDKVQRQH